MNLSLRSESIGFISNIFPLLIDSAILRIGFLDPFINSIFRLIDNLLNFLSILSFSSFSNSFSTFSICISCFCINLSSKFNIFICC